MKIILIGLFCLGAFASEISTNVFKTVKPALENALSLNTTYGEILNDASNDEKLGDKLSLKVLKQIKDERLQAQRSTALISIISGKLRANNLTEVDKVNLIKMKDSLSTSMKRNNEKISVLRSILLASKNHSLN